MYGEKLGTGTPAFPLEDFRQVKSFRLAEIKFVGYLSNFFDGNC
jgi:hypothetical protein